MSDISLAPALRRGSSHIAEIVLAFAALMLLAVSPSIHSLDLKAASLFLDADGGWLLPSTNRDILYWLLYRAPKLLLAGGGSIVLVVLLFRACRRSWRPADTRLLLVVSAFGLVPLLAGLLKAVTGVSCPAQELAFGGPFAHVGLPDRLLLFTPYNEHLRCWPAGHASGGFALLGLRLLFAPGARFHPWAVLPGLGAGWVLGIYQMSRGQHYLSHTAATMVLAFLLSSLACLILDRFEDRS